MKARIVAVTIGVAIGIVSGATIASVNDKMAEMFGAQSNFTRPGSAEGSMRGVLTGGSATVRMPIVTASGFSFDPPSVSAGCGGIDMYGGNLSFPSKEQYIATARAVVGNVGGYAFKSALKYVCEACESVMSAIQDTVQTLNMDNMNSCQIAQGVVDGSLKDSIANRGEKLSASWKEARGDVKDWFEGFNAGKGKDRPTKDAAADPEMAKVVSGNWTWSAMRDTGVFDWLGDDKGTREEVMSLLGTVVTCVPGQNGCEGEGTSPVPTTYQATLQLQDFVAPANEASAKRWVYSCSDETCLKVTRVERALGATVTQKITEGLLGTPDAPGILKRMGMSGAEAGTLSPKELALINNVPEIMSRAVACMNMGDGGEGYAKTIVEGMAPMVAADALFRATDQSLQELIRDVSQRDVAAGANMGKEMLEASRKELRYQHNLLTDNTKRNDMLMKSIELCSKSPIAAASYGVLSR